MKKEGRWVINGQKVWISRVQHSDLLILLARTTPLDQVQKKSDGLSCFIVELDKAIGNGLTVRPILNMVNHETNELFFDNLELPEDALLGTEGKGLKVIFDGLNAERTLIAAECIGDGYWFLEKARLCGRAQGVRPPDRAEPGHPVSARRIVHRAGGREPDALARLREIDARQNAGVEANMANTARQAGKRQMRACRRTVASASPANTTWSASSAKRACTRSRRFPPT